MAYSILIAGQVAATNTDSLVKSAKCASALENGNVVTLNELSTTSGESEVYMAATPVTATLTNVIYMVDEPINVLINSIYSGLTDDPREFNIAANKIFRATKPMVGDEIIISEDGLAGTKSTNTYVIPADDTAELTWGSSIASVSLAYELKETTSITVGNNKVTAYKFTCVKAS